MNPKLEKILKLPLWQRLTALGVVAVLIIAAFVWFMWLPKQEELTKLEGQLQKIEAELVQKRQIAKNLPKFKEEFAKMEKLLEQALTELPNQKEIPSLLTNLAALAKSNGLDVKKFQPQGEVPKGFFAEVPSQLSLEGSFHEMAEFAQAIGLLPRIVNISNLDLSGPKTRGNEAVLKIGCKVTTFRFIEK
ncbi:MAG: pilus assembly protein PilO [Desulfuromonas sp.]|nr:MAG: pilus assembly protein PilO [Desulfuromonas sp.]